MKMGPVSGHSFVFDRAGTGAGCSFIRPILRPILTPTPPRSTS